ncbi:MAG TPA: DUF4148 domain-containing protein, partial [Burkholderiaceae bacterium]
MNSKFLYAATVAISLVSTLAVADEAPVSRAQVTADLQQAIANGTLQRTDYDTGAYRLQTAPSQLTRSQVALAFSQARQARRPLNDSDANGSYNPYGAQLRQTSTLARSEVKAEVLQAAATGTLQRTDYDDVASLNRKATAQPAGPTFAQRVKARF